MKQIRTRLTYANVMSSLAVFLVLGGATAFAAGLGKNTVGSKQLKKNAVTTAKIKNNAITAAKIKNGAITGAKVDLGSLGTVPKAAQAENATHAVNATNAVNATKAASATNAENANNANNANTVGGLSVRRIFYATDVDSTPKTILSLGGLSLVATCTGGNLAVVAQTSVENASIHSGGTILGPEAFYQEEDGFDVGESQSILSGTEQDSNQGTFSYTTPSGGVVTATFASEEEDLDGNDCGFYGTAIG